MAERDVRVHDLQRPSRDAFVEWAETVFANLTEQPRLDVRRNDRDGVEQTSRGRAEARRAREHDVANGLRDVTAARCKRLDDEERVATRLPIQLGWIDRVRGRELLDSLIRQWLDAQPPQSRRRGDISEDDAKRMAPVEFVVAVAEDEQHGQVVDPPPEKLHHVERRRIRPVDVLQHQ